jgi:hypothetical protein
MIVPQPEKAIHPPTVSFLNSLRGVGRCV